MRELPIKHTTASNSERKEEPSVEKKKKYLHYILYTILKKK
jgi:hypothetical protein